MGRLVVIRPLVMFMYKQHIPEGERDEQNRIRAALQLEGQQEKKAKKTQRDRSEKLQCYKPDLDEVKRE